MRLESGWRTRNYRLERQFHQCSQPREAARCRPLLPSPLPLRHQPTRACAFAGARDCSPFGTGRSKIRSISAISLGDSAEEQDRMKSNRDGFGMPPATATLLRMALVYGWDRSEPSGLELFHPIQNLRNVKAGCAHHAGSMHMEKRHDVEATVHLGE